MLPFLRGSKAAIVVAGAALIALAGWLVVAAGGLLAGSALAPAALMLLSLLTGAAVAYGIECLRLPTAARYRATHVPLAGPRPGAWL